jgi:hopene-associated glycosyltransferase HpnB
VVALVPARDEAATIAETVRGVLGQAYPGPLHLVVCDDQSSDGTGRLARAAAEALGAGARLSIREGTVPPPGWTGKLWALAQAHAEAETAPVPAPTYLWLTDADIAHPPDTLRRLVTKAEDDDRDLVSLMVRLAAEGVWGRLLIPPFVLFFRLLYPFRWVNRPGRRTAAAAGGCVLVRRQALEAAGGFQRIAGAVIDDCALAAAIKRDGRPGPGRIWLGQADGSRSLRPYRGLGEVWAMVARSAYTQLRHAPHLLAGTVAGLALVFLAPPLLVLTGPWHGDLAALALGALAWAAMGVAAAPMLRHYGQTPARGALLPLAALLYLAMTVDSAWRYYRGQGGRWKGRVQARRPRGTGGEHPPSR